MRCSRAGGAFPFMLLLAACSSLSPFETVPASYSTQAPSLHKLDFNMLYAGGPTQNAVGIYRASARNPKPFRQIFEGLSAPTGMAADAAGNVYVCNNAGMKAPGKGTWTVTVYRRAAKKAFLTYTDGVWSPVDVAVASDGTVYVANYSSAVTVYPPGSVHPSRTLTGPSGGAPLGLALDAAGNLFVSYVNLSGGGSVYEYLAGQSTGSNLGIVFAGSPHGLAIDPRGNLVVAVSKAPSPGSLIEIFPPGKTQPKKTIKGTFQPFMLALGKSGRALFVADYGSGNGDGGVFEFAYPSGRLIVKDAQGPAASAYGLAIDLAV